MTSESETPQSPARPPGSAISPDYVRSMATELNRAHWSMGTELIGAGRDGVALQLDWRADLSNRAGAIAPGVLGALLDHACSLAAWLSLEDPDRMGTTVSLRVDYLEPPLPHREVKVEAEAVHASVHVMTVHGSVFHPGNEQRKLATAVCTVALAG